MDVKQAAQAATDYVNDLFQAEDIQDLGLEEVEYDNAETEWVITLGFSRPWDFKRPANVATIAGRAGPRRSYKILRIRESDGKVMSLKDRKVEG